MPSFDRNERMLASALAPDPSTAHNQYVNIVTEVAAAPVAGAPTALMTKTLLSSARFGQASREA
jgi:hypothetical protein